MKRTLLIVLTACFLTSVSFGQSAKIIDNILDTEEATFGQASYLILHALGGNGAAADFTEAFTELQARNIIGASVSSDDTLSFKQYAFLLMKAFDIKGGMLYRIYPCPRYAYRDLRYLSVFQGKTEPDRKVSGLEMLQVMGRIDILKGGEK